MLSEDEVSHLLIRIILELVGFHSFHINSIEHLSLAHTTYVPDIIIADNLDPEDIQQIMTHYAGFIPILVIHRDSLHPVYPSESIPNYVLVVRYPIDTAAMIAKLNSLIANTQDDLVWLFE